MDYFKESLRIHEEKGGKIEVNSKLKLESIADLSVAYTPGVAQPCLEISRNSEDAYRYTAKKNLVAVVSDGSAVLGLGNIGASAAIPVMEGKCVLFKEFGGVDAFPICIDSQDPDEIVNIVKNISPVFGGINLEDISAPRCFEIEKRLQDILNIPVFHDDQHGTAVVVCAALINALKLAGKNFGDIKIVICGAGAAGTAAAKMLLSFGAGDILICDTKGIISSERELSDPNKVMLAEITNKKNISGTLSTAVKDADVFIGVSVPGVLTKEMIRSMNSRPIVFALANPVPEIDVQDAADAGAFIVGTGRSDYPNQINNVLAFPGIFRGALDARAGAVTEEMKKAAAEALAGVVGEDKLSKEYIIPEAFDRRAAESVAAAVRAAAEK